MQGFLDLGDSYDSCITATLILFFSGTTPSSVSLFLIPLAVSCITVNVLSSLICSVGGEVHSGGVRVGIGDCRDGGAEQVSKVQFFSSDTVLHLRVRNISRAPIKSICSTCSSLLDL